MLLARPSRLLFKPPRAVGASVQLPTPRSCLCTETPSTLQTRASALTVVSLFAQRRVAPSLVTFSVRRHVSTTSAPPSPAAATDTSNPSASADAASNETALTWNRFLQLRAIRRRFNLVASLVSSAGTVTAGAAMLAALDLDAFSAQVPFGLDPVLALGLCTAGCGALGWLFGPFAGNALFGWWYRGLRREIGAKEKDLYHRLVKHRADPSGQSAQNPVPDYYGEKIASVAGYRQWLKDQRAFRKKREGYTAPA